MKVRILSIILSLITLFSCAIPSVAFAATQSTSEIVITKDNVKQVYQQALDGNLAAIDAISEIKACNKEFIKNAINNIDFNDGKTTHEIKFDDGSSIVIGTEATLIPKKSIRTANS